jgi:hypothetical protein
MQYQFTERYEFVKRIEFKNSSALQNVQSIRFFKEEEITGSFISKEFRYSFDNATWSNWETLTQNNLAAIQFRNQPNFWLQLNYNRTSVNSGNILRWYLYYDSIVPTPPAPPVEASINADTLGEQEPSYFLNRTNQYGPYTDLLVNNVNDGSTIGVYSSRTDLSSGTTFYFKRIGSATSDVSISEVSGKILIGFDRSFLDASTNLVYSYVDASLLNRDSSISQLYLMYGVYDSSISYLTLYDYVLDASISNLKQWNQNQDASIIVLNQISSYHDSSIFVLNNNLFVLESSIGTLTLWQTNQDVSLSYLRQWNISQDASLISLRAYVDGSLSTRDTSLGNLSKWEQAQDASLSFLRQWSLSQDASLISLRAYADGSLSTRDTSLGNLSKWEQAQDASIVKLTNADVSINAAQSIQDVSLKNLSLWEIQQDSSLYNLSRWQTTQDLSISILRTYVEGSINSHDVVQDASISLLRQWNITEDLSIVGLRNADVSINAAQALQDISLGNLSRWQITQDSSISGLKTYIDNSLTTRDTSLGNLSKWQITQDSSISGLKTYVDGSLTNRDASLLILFNLETIQDSSIVTLKQKDITLDASIIILRNADVSINAAQALQDVSLGNLSRWQVTQDSSITGLKTYVDGSLTTRDTSLGNLSKWEVVQDSSIVALKQRDDVQDASLVALRLYIDGSLNIKDSSLNNISKWEVVQDASIVGLRQKTIELDSSISVLTQLNALQDVSLKNLSGWNVVQDASIVWLKQKDSIIDSSIIGIKTRLNLVESSVLYLQSEQVINVGDGSAHVYSQRDLSNNVLLKTLKTQGPVTLREDSSVITIDASIVKIYDTTVEPSAFVPYTVGGVTKGTLAENIRNENYTELFDQILFPTVNPTITEPYCTFTHNAGTVNVASSNIYVDFVATFNRGLIDVNDVFQNYRAGLPYEYIFTGPDVSGTFASSSSTYSFLNEPVDVSFGLTIWTAKVKYNGGPQPYNSRGTNVGTFLDASTTRDVSVFTEGVWPLFATSSVINILSEQTAISMLYSVDATIDLVSESNGYKHRFDIPYQWINAPTNRLLKGIQTYSEIGRYGIGDCWEYQGGDASTSLRYWDVSTATHTVQSNSVNYITYTYNGVDRSAIKIKLIF